MIAKTGNRITDQIARGRAKHMAEERRVKAAAKKAARKGKGGGKFRGAGKAGRAAARRPAKGIAAKRLSRQGSGSKTAAYGLKDGAELVLSNCGYDARTIGEGLSPKTRPEIKNQIERMTFSTPACSGQASAEEWRERVEFIRTELGINDSFSYCASRHTDQEHDHIHLDFNRVNDQGDLWKDNQIGLRLAAIEEKIEQRFDLKLTRREDFLTRGNLSKNDIERATREGVQPAFLQVQAAIIEASRDKPDVLTFVARLADQGIACRPNLRQDELNGFSYKMGYQSFTGKQVGANWNELKKEVTYDPDEHFAALANLKQLVDASKTRPDKPARADASRAERIESSTPRATVKISEPKPEPSALETQTARPDKPARRSEVSQANTRLANRVTDVHTDGVPPVRVNEVDPIVQKMRARQALIDKLRTETGDRRELAQKLAQRIERGELYHQRQIVKKFVEDHKADPRAVAIVKSHIPELAPAAPQVRLREPMQELPERLRLADRYQPPTPSESTDYELPTM